MKIYGLDRPSLAMDWVTTENESLQCCSMNTDMAHDVVKGLLQQPQKVLSSMYLYDRDGSALYEKITTLPEYYPTRTEYALLQSIAPELLSIANPVEIVERQWNVFKQILQNPSFLCFLRF